MKPKALFIGGTGTISTAITAALAAEGKWELTLLNRGNRNSALPEGVARTLDHILSHPELQVPDPEFDAWCDRVLVAVDKAKASLRKA